jgi:hypothetical protein
MMGATSSKLVYIPTVVLLRVRTLGEISLYEIQSANIPVVILLSDMREEAVVLVGGLSPAKLAKTQWAILVQ